MSPQHARSHCLLPKISASVIVFQMRNISSPWVPAGSRLVVGPSLSTAVLLFGVVTFGAVGCSSGTGSAPAGATATGGSGNGTGSSAATGTGGASISGSGGSVAATGTGGGLPTGGTTISGSGGTDPGSSASGGASGATGGTTGGWAGASGNPGTGGGQSAGGAGAGGAAASGGAGGASGFVDLFNGTDLTGFKVYKASSTANNAPGMLLTGAAAEAIFKPENGMIHVYPDQPNGSPEFHYLLQTAASYSKFNVSWDYKWGTKKFSLDGTMNGKGTDLQAYPRDAGVLWYIHGDITQVWPSSIEFQNKWGTAGDIFALYAQCKSLGSPKNMTQYADAASGGVSVTVVGGLTQHLRSANFEMPGVGPNAATGEGSDWNTCLLQVDNGVSTYSVNGHVVNGTLSVMDSSGKAVTSGPMAWQGEQAEVYYRNLRIQVLP